MKNTYSMKLDDSMTYEIEVIGEFEEVTVLRCWKQKDTWKKKKSITMEPFTIAMPINEMHRSSNGIPVYFESLKNWLNTILPGINKAHKKFREISKLPKEVKLRKKINRCAWEVARWVEANHEYRNILATRSDRGFDEGVRMWYRSNPNDKRKPSTIRRAFRRAAQKLPRFFPERVIMERRIFSETSRRAYGSDIRDE